MRILLILLVLITSFCFRSASARDLKAEMSAALFTEAGLDKLSAAELARLNEYLSAAAHSATQNAPPIASSDRPSPAQSAPLDTRGLPDPATRSREPIESRILGRFRGWDGATRFELENGQVWVQTDRSETAAFSVESPNVVVKPGSMGSWFFKLRDSNRSARVKRIQ